MSNRLSPTGFSQIAVPVPARRWSRAVLALLVTVAMLLVGAATLPSPANAATTTVGDFESGADGWGVYPQGGATGAFTQVSTDSVTGSSSGEITLNVGAGGYVELAKDISLDVESLSFSLRSTQLTSIAVRFIDSEGQAFQHFLTANPAAPGWQTLTVEDPEAAPLHFGGANDGVWRGQATKLALLVDGGQVVNVAEDATYLLDAIQVTGPDAPIEAPPVVPDSVLVGGFESDAEGWGVFPQAGAVSGAYERVDSGDTSGGMSGDVTVDLSGVGDAEPGGYVELARNLPSLDLTGLTFSVRSSQLTSIAIRFTDSTGQAFQHYRDLVPAAPGWQTFTINDPAVGATFHFGGDNDGVWHGPASKVAFLVDSGQLVDATQPASYLLDAVQAHVPPAPPAPSTVIGDFEGESEGWAAFANAGAASASFQTVASDFVTGTHSAEVTVDASTGGYGEFTRPLPGVAIDDLTFSVKSNEIQFISARLRDSTGQFFQHLFTVNPAATGWQSFTITDLAATGLHFGGADDGVWHGPATAIAFNVDQGSIVDPTQPASYLLDAVTATLVPADLALTSTTLGNVFTVGDAVSVGVETNAGNLSWSVKNAAGAVVVTGSGTSASLGGTIDLALTTPGWYQLDVSATGPGDAAFTASTTLAVIHDFDRAELKDERFGVATHFGQDWDPAIVPLIEKAGFGSVRDEAYWDQQETVQGTVTPTPKVLAFESALNAADVNLLLVLSYGNPFYEDNKAPVTEAGIAAYANYANEMVEHFGTDDTNYEVWNEFNIHFGAGPAGSRPDAYFNLLKESYETIKATNPDAEVIGPVTAGVPIEWLRDFFELGGLDYIDALSVHPYTYPAGPESLDETIAELRAVMAEYGTVKPIVISEVGWPTGIAARSIDDITQAQYLVQSQTIALANDVQQYFIYNFMDKGTDPTDTEHRFGLVHNSAETLGAYTPKPSYVSIATSQRMLAGKAALGQVPLADGIEDYEFDSGAGKSTHVVWSAEPQSVSYAATGPVTVTDLFGASTTIQPDQNGQVTVTAGKSPLYLEGTISEVRNGGTYALTVDPGFVGQDITGHWSIDNSAGSATLEASLQIEDQTLSASVPAGETQLVDVTLPGLSSPGTANYTGVVLEGTTVVAQLFASATVSEAVSFTAYRALVDGADVLRLRVSNASTTPQTVSGVSWDIGGNTGSALAGAEVPAAGSIAHDVALPDIAAATPYTAQVTIESGPVLQASGTLHPIGPITQAAEKRLVVDGELDAGLQPNTRIDFGQTEAPELPGWAGPSDLSGQFWFSWDDEFLYLSADVLDNVHSQTATGGNIWQGDSVQIAVGTGAPGDATVWNELGIALTEDGPQSHQWFQAFDASAPQIEVEITRDDTTDHTVYEAAIPWSRLAPAVPDGRLVSIGAVVNDSDGADRRGWISWGGGIAGEKASEFFNAVQLVEADVLTATVDPATPNGSNGWYSSGPVMVTLASSGGNPIEQRIGTPSNPDGMWVEYDGPIVLTSDGDYTIGYRLAGDTGATTSVQVRLDSTAPVVAATVDEGDSTVTLTATDANAAEGLSIEYSVDAGASWLPYTAPVTLAEAEQLQYRATDAAGNTSAVRSVIPIEVLKAPKITGSAKIGKTLTASAGSWSVPSPVLSYQWNRDGSPIEGANGTTYTLVAEDAGSQITVTVTASKDGFTDTSSTSDPKMVTKLKSSTASGPDRLFVSRAGTTVVTVRVQGEAGVVPTGEVRIYDGTRLISSDVLEAGDAGQTQISISGLTPGIHLITARYAGNQQLSQSLGLPRVLIVF